MALMVSIFMAQAGGPTSTCVDWNGYVNSKNVGQTGFYTLLNGFEEKAAQTYHYSGPGKINQVKVYGHYNGVFSPGVPLRVSIYNVDANGRPTTIIQSVDQVWWLYNNANGYITVSFGSGVYVNSNFAVGVEILPQVNPFGNTFQVGYTGNGEGNGENLASLAGSSTGGNWASALTEFSKDGDFYLIPEMTNFNNPSFEIASQCVSTTTNIVFTNTTQMNRDSMFNRIGLAAYTGSNKYYSWNFGDGSPVSNAFSPTHSYAAAGSYTVTLTSTIDGWSGVCTETYSMEVSVGLSSAATVLTNVLCNGGTDGSITAAGNGGATPYNYSINGENYQSSPSFTGLAAGNYTLYVKDNLGCSHTSGFTITQPNPIIFAVPQTTNASCGSANGQILISAVGGTAPIRYKIGSGTYKASGLFTGLNAGSYIITARDTNACTSTISITVSDQGGPSLTVVSTTNVSCNGGNDGTIVLSGSGGTGALQYSINGGVSYSSTTAYLNLTAGTYGVLVKDAAGCKTGTTVTITQPTPLRINATATPANCNGSYDGEINVVSAIGGIGSLSYSVNGVTYQSGTNFPGLSSGTYTVYVRDVAGCLTFTTATVNQPTPVTATVTVSNPGCNGSYDGSISIGGSGGAGGYTYSLDGENFERYGLFLNLPGGGYTVYVKDKNGCGYSTSVTLTQPSAITGNVLTTNSTCGNNNGSILVTAAGGSGSGYQYSVDGTIFNSTGAFGSLFSGTYYIIIRDGSGCQKVVSGSIYDSNGPSIVNTSHTNVACHDGNDGSITVNTVTGGTGTLQYGLNGSAWQTSNVFTGLYAGNYTVMVKDANGCIGYVSEVLTEPSPIVVNTTVVDLTCNGVNHGKITVSAIGGAGTLAYSINQGSSFQSSNVFNNLYAGSYTLKVRDAAGCMGSTTAAVTQPTAITIVDAVLNVSCFDAGNGIISIVSYGGTGSATYSLDGTTYQTSSTFINLSGGHYTVYVKDSLACVVNKNITVTEPTALYLTAAVSDVSCAGGNNGVVNVSISGGVGHYEYAWNTGSASEDLFNLSAGTYTATVTDANGCSVSRYYVVSQPALPIIVNGTVTGSTGTNGAVDITTTGGSAPYTFHWNSGEFTEDLTGLTPGTYTVEVTDANGCATSNVFTVPSLTGIGNVNADAVSVMIYPNPAQQIATVEISGAEMRRLDVFNILGQTVFTSEAEQAKLNINTTDLSAGTYLVKIMVNNTVITKHLQVVH